MCVVFGGRVCVLCLVTFLSSGSSHVSVCFNITQNLVLCSEIFPILPLVQGLFALHLGSLQRRGRIGDEATRHISILRLENL